MDLLSSVIGMLTNASSNTKMTISKDEVAELLKTTPEALDAFEKAYTEASAREFKESDNFFDVNSRQAVSDLLKNIKNTSEKVELLTSGIVDELLDQTNIKRITDKKVNYVSNDDLKTVPENIRPQLTGHLMKVDINEPSYLMLLDLLNNFLKTGNMQAYHMFRQGLDTLDLDPVTYEIIGMNKNTMGYWFPALKNAVSKQCFFKIPETKILKVPLPLLQLTRCEFGSLTPTTIDIVNRWAYEAFDLDENKTYFVKTGTYSSKFDFRNAKVTTPKEVRELGSYLLFIHFQALQMASPLARPCIYGVSTTNEWCVREYIEDKENNPCIYHGMPLHTEYRVFIDCDTDEVLGIAPYWKPDVMKKRFSQGSDADTADMKHDYIIYKMHEEKLMSRYEENKDMLVDRIAELLPEINLTGQWSLDIMQNGNDFWLIDMATADTSALNECVPPEKLKRTPENWIPKLPDISSITHH
jgi:hypothetical protein